MTATVLHRRSGAAHVWEQISRDERVACLDYAGFPEDWSSLTIDEIVDRMWARREKDERNADVLLAKLRGFLVEVYWFPQSEMRRVHWCNPGPWQSLAERDRLMSGSGSRHRGFKSLRPRPGLEV